MLVRLGYSYCFCGRSISYIYGDGKLDDKDIQVLDKLSTDISDSYGRGGITNEHYTNLKNEISRHYQKIFKKCTRWMFRLVATKSAKEK